MQPLRSQDEVILFVVACQMAGVTPSLVMQDVVKSLLVGAVVTQFSLVLDVGIPFSSVVPVLVTLFSE